MKYTLDLEEGPKKAPRIALHGKSTVRSNLNLLGKLAKSKMTSAKEIEEVENLIGKILRGLNEV